MTFGGTEVMIALPIVGAAVTTQLPGVRRANVVAIAVASVVLAWSIGSWIAVTQGDPGFHSTSDGSWIPAIGVRWLLGLDAISAPLVVLTALLGWCCLIALLKRAPACGGTTGLIALVLLIEGASIGTFVSLDLIVFFVFFELVLIPMWFVIADYGDEHDPEGRRRAATRFLVVTVIGSAFMLIGFVLLRSETGSFQLPVIAERASQIPHDRQVLIAILLMIGFGAKVPIWPLHFWLPDAHSKAPTVGSVLLAGVLLKLGTYGLLRFWYAGAPSGAVDVAPYLGAIGVVGIVYGALACLGQRDLKRLIAYSSIGHMGFVVLAISTLTAQGFAAANYANVAHGVITGLLFFVVGGLKDRVGSSDFGTLGRGWYARSPHLASAFAIAAMASLGLPGLAGFWGEMLTVVAAQSPNPALPVDAYRVLMGFAGLGIILTTAYFVVAIRRLCQGLPGVPELGETPALTPDISGDEWVAWSPLIALTVALGVAPTLMLWSAGPAYVFVEAMR